MIQPINKGQAMPVVKQVTYYSFDELSEQAQQRVMDKVREDCGELFETDEEFILEDYKERNPHIHNMDICYSGFHSQGDGASFTGYLDSDWAIEYLKKRIGTSEVECLRFIGVSFERVNHFYVHENSVNTELCDSVDWATHIEENETLSRSLNSKIQGYVGALDEYRRDLCNEIYDSLHLAYEYCISDENVIELILSNDFLFDIDGNFE